jgi:hypothetical protein
MGNEDEKMEGYRKLGFFFVGAKLYLLLGCRVRGVVIFLPENV